MHGSPGATAIDQLVAAGAAAWPSLSLSPLVFHQHLESILGDGGGTESRPLFIGDLFLACCCAHLSPAIRIFEREYLIVIEQAARSVQPSPAFVDEVRQRLNVSLFVGEEGRPPRILKYSGRGPLGIWTRIAAQRVAQRLRHQSSTSESSAEELLLDRVTEDADPFLAYLKESYREELRKAFYDAFSSVPASDRVLLRLHYVDDLSMDRIAVIYRVHQTTISRRLKAIREHILEDAKSRLRHRLALSTAECESLVRLVQSQLDVSLCRLFEDEG